MSEQSNWPFEDEGGAPPPWPPAGDQPAYPPPPQHAAPGPYPQYPPYPPYSPYAQPPAYPPPQYYVPYPATGPYPYMVPYWIPLEQRPWWTFARTPHLGRLLKKLRSQPLPPNAEKQLPQWALAGCLLLVAATFVASPLLALLVVILPPIPILLPTVAARIVARDVASPQYELIKLSSLSDRALFRGYLYAALWKMRWWIGALLAGLLPYLLGCWCIMTFAFDSNGAVMSVFTLWGLVNLIHLAGLLPALIGLGVAAGLRFPRVDVMTVAIPLVAGLALIGGQLLGIGLFNATIERSPIFVAQGTTYNYYETTIEMGPWFWVGTVLYMVCPYLVWLLAMRLGARWVRRPVG